MVLTKVAMWAVFIFIMGIIGVLLINIFGNITTTNQQDYTLIKNTVEAAMYDSIDIASYRAGFYLCIKPAVVKNNNNQFEFTSKDDYDVVLNHNVNLESLNREYAECNYLLGEVKLNKDVFVESFLRRFASNVNNNKNYNITIQEVIEYPPKVSVRIDTFNTYDSSGTQTLEYDEGDFNIRNQVDAIFESTN